CFGGWRSKVGFASLYIFAKSTFCKYGYAIFDNKSTTNTNLPPHCNFISDGTCTSNSHLRGKKTHFSDNYIVSHVYLIVKNTTFSTFGCCRYTLINCAARANHHVIFYNNVATSV